MEDGETRRARLFISYPRLNRAEVFPFAEALREHGIQIWMDHEELDPFDDFPARIRDGLASCHALLAWYSPEYAESSYCQKELTAAWICAQRITRHALSHILVVNPSSSIEHIALGDVGRQNYLKAPEDATSQMACIQSIDNALAGLSDAFGALREFKTPKWHPEPQYGSTRFVGRLRDLWRIHTALKPVGISEYEDPHIVVQLRGLGGVGKTLLAVEYAKRFGASYPGGIHWLRAYGFDANKPIAPEVREREHRWQIESLALMHDVDIRDRDFREIARDLGRRLEAGGAYLWVVDDLPPALDQEHELPSWYAPSANGCTLITTRSGDYEGIGTAIEVDVMAAKPALELLTKKRKPQSKEEWQQAMCLAEDLGLHALALDVAGQFLLTSRSFAELRAEVTREATVAGTDPLGKLVAGLSGQLPGGHQKSIVATLLMSVAQLDEQGLSLLRLATVLDGSTPVSLRLAKEVFQRAFALDEAAAADYLAHAENQTKMHSLATTSSGGAGGEALSVHSLVCYTMRHGDPAHEQAAVLRETLRGATVAALVDLLVDVSDIRKHAGLDSEIAHAQHLLTEPQSAAQVLLATRLERYEGERGNYRGALEFATNLLPRLERALGPDHPETLTTRYDVAFWTGQAGAAVQSLRLFRKLLPDQQRVLGPRHPDTLRTRGNIAEWTGHIGRPSEAVQLYRKLWFDQERALGPYHANTLATRQQLAMWTGYAGAALESLRQFRVLLPDQQRVLGADHPSTLRTRFQVADWTGQVHKVDEALRLFRDLLPDQERVLGSDHPDTLMTRHNIGFYSGQMGAAAEALRLFRDLLPDQERVLGADHPNTLRARHNIADWTGQAGKPAAALRLLKDLLPDQERILGHDHPETLTTRGNIAFYTWETGATAEALEVLRNLWHDQQRVLGSDHPDTLGTSKQIALWTSQI